MLDTFKILLCGVINAFRCLSKLVHAGKVPVQKSVTDSVFLKKNREGAYLVEPQNKAVIFSALETCREQSQLPEFMHLAQVHALPYIHSMLRQEITPELCGQKIAKTVTHYLRLVDRDNPRYDYTEQRLKEAER